jgi:hypothetical protein
LLSSYMLRPLFALLYFSHRHRFHTFIHPPQVHVFEAF